MMQEMHERFESFYLFANLLRRAEDTAAQLNLRFDSTRRFIDIVRFVNRRWPFSTPYISSLHGDLFWRPLFENFPVGVSHCPTLFDASIARAAHVIHKLDAGFLSELIRYEDFRNGVGIFHYSADAAVLGMEIPVLIPYDLSSFYLSLSFYGRASAPPFLYQQLDIEPGLTYRFKKQ